MGDKKPTQADYVSYIENLRAELPGGETGMFACKKLHELEDKAANALSPESAYANAIRAQNIYNRVIDGSRLDYLR